MRLHERDWESVRRGVVAAEPFPFFCIDDFLSSSDAQRVASAFPSFAEAEKLGFKFSAVNERNKIQITDARVFPPALCELHEMLASREFLDILERVMGISGLRADATLAGGGIHQTGPRGHLDVHVDFNVLESHGLFRRLNILVYFNENWDPSWGGNLELWDARVQRCHHSIESLFNRCVVFETSDISFHGVSAVTCPMDKARKSFAAYYYTSEPPARWDGKSHSTIFRARPDEAFKATVSMPLESAGRKVTAYWRVTKHSLKRLLRRD